jgi:hypothetical protein
MTLGSAFLVLLFAFAIAGMAEATDRRQAYANAALCLLAVRPDFAARRQSHLQSQYASSASKRNGLIGLS